MNIFLLSRDPAECASYHCDKHVCKMIIESAQMLCAAHWVSGASAPYKLTHSNHPCTKWVRESLTNYKFLCVLAYYLTLEYEKRYNKIHKTKSVITWCLQNLPEIEDVGLTPFPQAMPDKYKSFDPVIAYRNYYVGEKLKFLKYKNTPIPSFLRKHLKGGDEK